MTELKSKGWDDFKVKIVELKNEIAVLQTEKLRATDFGNQAFASQTIAEQQLFENQLQLEELRIKSNRSNRLVPQLQQEIELMQVRNEDVREVLDIFLEDRRNVISMMEQDLPDVLEKLQKSGKLLDYDLLKAKAKAEISQRIINLVEKIESFVKTSAGTQTSIGNLDFTVQIQRKGLNGMLSDVKQVVKIE